MKRLSLFVFIIALTFNMMASGIWGGSSEPWTIGDGILVAMVKSATGEMDCCYNVGQVSGGTAGFEPREVQVFNALGQKVKTYRNMTEINVSDWPKGVYVLHITTADGKVIEKSIIQ